MLALADNKVAWAPRKKKPVRRMTQTGAGGKIDRGANNITSANINDAAETQHSNTERRPPEEADQDLEGRQDKTLGWGLSEEDLAKQCRCEVLVLQGTSTSCSPGHPTAPSPPRHSDRRCGHRPVPVPACPFLEACIDRLLPSPSSPQLPPLLLRRPRGSVTVLLHSHRPLRHEQLRGAVSDLRHRRHFVRTDAHGLKTEKWTDREKERWRTDTARVDTVLALRYYCTRPAAAAAAAEQQSSSSGSAARHGKEAARGETET